jgi:hypothetical protein
MEGVIGSGPAPAAQLGSLVSTQELYGAYSDFTRRRSARVDGLPRRVLTKICGPSRRLPVIRSPHRSPGHSIPSASQLTKLVHSHLQGYEGRVTVMVTGMRVGGCKMLWQGCQGWNKKIKGSTLQEALCAFFPMHPDLHDVGAKR